MAVTVALSTDWSKTRDVTISSGSGTIGVKITDPISGTATTTTVVWATSDNDTAIALAAAINAETAYNSYISAGTPTAGVFTLTYSGPVGLVCPLVAAGSGSGLTVAGNLGIYASGQQITVSVPVNNGGSSDLTITYVENATGLVGLLDGSASLVGLVATGSTTTTFAFPASIKSGQADQMDVALDYRIILGATVATTTTCTVTVGPPHLTGGVFPTD